VQFGNFIRPNTTTQTVDDARTIRKRQGMASQVEQTEPFVSHNSVVRRIWGDVDVVMLVFAGSAAEFGLNAAVDWLFVTGDLPRDPIGRFLATVAFARRIAFGSRREADGAFAAIRAAHTAVEQRRGARIPAWAHRDVLYMLIDHSERAFRALHRPLVPTERHDLYDVFRRVGEGLGIPELPSSYEDWVVDRERHLERDLVVTPHTVALAEAYRREIGAWRYVVLRQLQAMLAPPCVRDLLRLPRRPWIRYLLPLHPLVVRLKLRRVAQWLLVPSAHLDAVRALE
jgi:uncharacterized protein (DUF2236 family)